MNRKLIPQLVALVAMVSVLSLWPTGAIVHMGGLDLALAAEELKVEGLPRDAKGFRAQVEQIISRVDKLIEKLKENPTASTMVLDLMQTRDSVLRELPKVDNQPAGSAWSEKEARESVEWMLRLLKVQYDKASSSAS